MNEWVILLNLERIVCSSMIQIVAETGHDQRQHFDLTKNLPPLSALEIQPVRIIFLKNSNSIILTQIMKSIKV